MLRLSCVLLCFLHLCWSADYQVSPLEIEFFSFSAPNEAFQQKTHAPKQVAAPNKIHQQVIFIQNPENRANNKALPDNSAQGGFAQKTRTYLLNKAPNVSATKQKLQQTQQQTYHKPESKHAKYHGEPRNIQEKIAQELDEERVRYYV